MQADEMQADEALGARRSQSQTEGSGNTRYLSLLMEK